MSSAVVHVKNISHETSDKEVRDFFSFCGKISSLSVTPASDAADSPKTATVTFEKETAAKTALLLDNTQLGPSQVSVSAASSIGDIAPGSGEEEELTQEDKPRSRIVAEYLAHGYVLSDQAISKAIALDNKHGISSRFTNALTSFDSKYKATDKAKGIDASYGISDKAAQGWRGMMSYYEKAIGTPTGQKLADFYTKGNKQVQDVHTEARRLADLKAGKSTGPSSHEAAPGHGGSFEENAKHLTPVEGGEKTVCTCGGDSGVCPCVNCSCAGCAKSKAKIQTATGDADKLADNASVAPIGEKV